MRRGWLAALPALLCLVFLTSWAPAVFASQNVTLRAPAHEIEILADGAHRILLKDFYSYGVPGYPDLPSRMVRVVVPPDVVPESIRVTCEATVVEEPGTFTIRKLPSLAARGEEEPLPEATADLFSRDAFFPVDPVAYLGFSQMRKWRYITLKYTPFQYNPVQRTLRSIPEATLSITYERMKSNPLPEEDLTDQVMDERAREMFENFPEAQEWYLPKSLVPRPSAIYNYVIVTTNAIQGASAQLSAFLSYLSGKGLSPLVVTESQYSGLTGQAPNGTAEKIRQWLKQNYIGYGIKYVLLIGDPNPTGDVPMKQCWPRRDQLEDRDSPTDYFYADLTGNWDLNGNGYYGEYNGDRGTGGVDFANEVYVGRIPVYSGVGHLDAVLAKTMTYGTATDVSWRKAALLPMAYSDASTDGAYLSEAMATDYLTPKGISRTTLYQKGTYCAAANSSFPASEELLDMATRNRWSTTPYGLVWWWGHGSPTGAYIGYTDCPPTGNHRILESADTGFLNDQYPAHVYQCSCSNGTPEDPNNLGTALLYRGAITTVSASRVSYYAQGSWSTSLKYTCDNASIGYYYGREVVASGRDVSTALYMVKSDMGANANGAWQGSQWTNLFDFNLYGDPSLGLLTGGTTGVSLAADFVGQGLWVNGTTWGQISGWNPLRMASWTGGLAAEFGPEKGLWTYNGASWSWLTAWKVAEVLSGWKGGLAVGFGTGTGLWNWSGSAWTQLVGGWDPTVLCGWTQGLAAGFGYGRGTWIYDGSAWKQIAGWDPGLMTAWSGGLAVAFGPGTGLWNWNGTAWTQLVGGWDPLILSGWDQGIAVGFGQNRGLWNWTGSGWAWLTGWKDPLALAGWKNGLAVGFGIGTGLWNWSGASWSQVTGWDPWQLVGVSFPTQGTCSEDP